MGCCGRRLLACCRIGWGRGRAYFPEGMAGEGEGQALMDEEVERRRTEQENEKETEWGRELALAATGLVQTSGSAADGENSCGGVGGFTRSVAPGRERRRMQYWSWLEGFAAAPKTPEQGPKKRKWCANADADLSSATKSERPAEEKQGRRPLCDSVRRLRGARFVFAPGCGVCVRVLDI